MLPGDLQRTIADAVRPLERLRTRVCLTRKENLHITLKFLGDVSVGKLQEVASLLMPVAGRRAPFEIEIAGIGAFPDVARARIIWVGVSRGAQALKLLSRDIEESLTGVGFEDEDRFKAHVTVGRIRHASRTPELETELKDRIGTLGGCRVSAFYLMKSTLASGGSVYEVLEEFRLSGEEPSPEFAG